MRPVARLSTWAALALLVTGTVAACSSGDSSTAPEAPIGPAVLQLSQVLGPDCQGRVSVVTTLENWTLRAPGVCASAPQCGTIRVSLLASDQTVISSSTAANATPSVVVPAAMLARVASVRVQLIDDAGNVYQVGDGSQDSATSPVTLSPAAGCTGAGNAGGAAGEAAGGAASEAGSAGRSESMPGGAAGMVGEVGFAGSPATSGGAPNQ